MSLNNGSLNLNCFSAAYLNCRGPHQLFAYQNKLLRLFLHKHVKDRYSSVFNSSWPINCSDFQDTRINEVDGEYNLTKITQVLAMKADTFYLPASSGSRFLQQQLPGFYKLYTTQTFFSSQQSTESFFVSYCRHSGPVKEGRMIHGYSVNKHQYFLVGGCHKYC